MRAEITDQNHKELMNQYQNKDYRFNPKRTYKPMKAEITDQNHKELMNQY